MSRDFRAVLWNRAVAVVFGLPAVGYLGVLSQFWVGEQTGLLAVVLEGGFLLAYPVLTLYSALLDVLPPTSQQAGTVGFFVFAYLLAVAVVSVARRLLELGRRYRASGSEAENPRS